MMVMMMMMNSILLSAPKVWVGSCCLSPGYECHYCTFGGCLTMLAIVVVYRCHSCGGLLMAFLLWQLSHIPLWKLVLRMVTCERQTQMVLGVHSVFSNNAENNWSWGTEIKFMYLHTTMPRRLRVHQTWKRGVNSCKSQRLRNSAGLCPLYSTGKLYQ